MDGYERVTLPDERAAVLALLRDAHGLIDALELGGLRRLTRPPSVR